MPRGSRAHAVTVAVLCGIGWLAATIAGVPRGPAFAGIASAGALQAIAFWRLDRKLSAGRDATRTWIAGIAARFGAFGLMAAMALTGAAPRVLAMTFAFTLITLVLLEAAWLAFARRPAAR